MKVYYDQNLESKDTRAHPWDVAAYDSESKYYNFRQKPELIPLVLEDFKPWSHYKAIHSFYDLLRWLNSEDSCIESNDSGFGGLTPNKSSVFPKELQCAGRLIIFYRKVNLNIDEQFTNWLKDAAEFHIRQINNGFEWGALGLASMNTRLIDLPSQPVGKSLQIHWWAFGKNESEAMENLDILFLGLGKALKNLSDEIGGLH
jgi:hypothetical protein